MAEVGKANLSLGANLSLPRAIKVRMEAVLLQAVRQQNLQTIWSTLNTLACRQQAEATAGLKFFKKPPQLDGDMTKDRFWSMTKEERLLWQRSKEEERRVLNAAAGIDGDALLTKENVERWRSEGMTFSAIARDIIGCTQETVAAALKGVKRKMPWRTKKDDKGHVSDTK